MEGRIREFDISSPVIPPKALTAIGDIGGVT